MAYQDILKSSELFTCLDAHHLDIVSVFCRSGSYTGGAVIFAEGAPAEELHILTSGRIALDIEVRPVPDRPPVPTTVELVRPKECFGWSALVEPYVYTMSARCSVPCTTVAIKGSLLRKALADDPAMGHKVMEALAQLIALRLAHTRLRLVSGLALTMPNKEQGASS